MEITKKNDASLDQYRIWQRNQEFEPVIELLYPVKETCTEQEKAILALSLIISGDTNGQVLLKEVSEQTPDPSDPLWQSDVALACMLNGQLKKSLDLLLTAVSSSESTAVEYGRLGAVYMAAEDLEKARINYQESVYREPGRAEWHNNLAGILVRQQKLEEALENYDIALKIKPDLEVAQQARQRVYLALERTEDLVQDLQEKHRNDPDDYLITLQLSRAFDLDNRPAEGIKLLRNELISVEDIPAPETGLESEEKDVFQRQFTCRMTMADIFMGRSMYGRALPVLRQLEKMEPDNPVPVICKQAQCLAEIGSYDKALEKLDDLPEGDDSEDNSVKTTKANVLCEKGDFAQAEGILRELLETYPGNATLLTQLGQTLLWVGNLDEAVVCFEKAAEINPMALASMVSARKIPDDPESLEKMRKIADNVFIPSLARENMSFALSKVYDRLKEYDTAFNYLDQANKIADKRLKYDPDQFTRKTKAVAKIFNQQYFGGIPRIRKSDRTPVFVVGMPRSGTTLTEQILGSHPEIFGAGELPIIPRLTALMPKSLKVKKAFPWCMLHMTPHLREEAARHYLFGLYEYDREHSYVVDKMPHNFVNLGLIASIFPSAKIIHVKRDPRDIAVSNFQQNFKARFGGMGFAFNLENIARQINDYHSLMNHWRQILPLPLFELSYEQMVEDMEGTARKLLDFVGVEWDDNVTRFYQSKRAVRTASVTQVRQPIYKTSMKKWKRYGTYLEDLLENLKPEVTNPWDNPTDDNNPYESKVVFRGKVMAGSADVDPSGV